MKTIGVQELSEIIHKTPSTIRTYTSRNPELLPPRRKERSCLSSHGHTASSTLDLFDTACGTKPERLIDYAKVMKPYPTQEMDEQ